MELMPRKKRWTPDAKPAKRSRPTRDQDADTAPDWSQSCGVCGQGPVVPITGMCGPCSFGEADTAGGNW